MWLLKEDLQVQRHEARMLLSLWAGMHQVKVVTAKDDMLGVFFSAWEWLEQNGLPVPRRLSIKALRLLL